MSNLYKAMSDYYQARAGSASGMAFEAAGQIAGLASAYFVETRKRANEKLKEFDVTATPKSLSLWNSSGMDYYSNKLDVLNDRMNKARKNPKKNKTEIMNIYKEYEAVKTSINKLPGFMDEAKNNADGDNYSRASSDKYINQVISENYEVYENDEGKTMIKLFTDTPDGQLTSFDGTLDDFDDMIFLERKDVGDNIVKIIDKIVKNQENYEDGELQQALGDIVGDKEVLSSAFWDDIFQLTSGPFNTTTLADQFALEAGYDASKMDEYKISSAIFNSLDPETQGERLNEMQRYVFDKVNMLSRGRYQSNLKPKKGAKGTMPSETIDFEGGSIELFKEKYKTVDVGGTEMSPIIANNLLRKIEAKYVDPGSEFGVSFEHNGGYYKWDGQDWRVTFNRRHLSKPKKWDVYTETQVLDELGFGAYMGMSSGGGSQSTNVPQGGGRYDNK